MYKRFGTLILTASMVLSCGLSDLSVSAKNTVNVAHNQLVLSDTKYEEYLMDAESEVYGNTLDYTLLGIKYSQATDIMRASETSDITKSDEAVFFKKQTGKATYIVNVTDGGIYNLAIKYALVADNSKDVSFSLTINESLPFDGANELVLKRYWKDSTDGTKTDAFGNEYAPTQIAHKDFIESVICDENDANYKEYIFKLEKGVNYVTLSDFSDDTVIDNFTFKAVKENISYKEYVKQYSSKSNNGDYKIYEGEAAVLKSTRSLVPKSDSASAAITPADAVQQKINYIGGTGWTAPGEKIVWNIDVPVDGFYKIAYCYKQDQKINSISYRTLEIDGKIPFKECESLEFGYGVDWQNKIAGNGEDFLFYLKKGEHTLSMTATLGVTADYYNSLKNVLTKIGDVYVEITMITGESPDTNRDYELFNAIPDFNNRLLEIQKELSNIATGMKKLSDGNTTAFITSIKDMERILTSMVENKYDAQKYVKNYSTAYTTLCNSLYDMRSAQLSIDKIYIIPEKNDFSFETVGFFKKFLFGAKRFVAAFSSDYGKLSETDSEEKQLKIWVNWGRDQATVLNSLISESFVQKTGIQVNVEVTNASLIYGMLSGNAPDLALQMTRTEPVNLAMRGALVDLSQYEDYPEVIKRFGDSATTPYKYGNGVYALPDQQSFYIMFYRKDILDNLGIKVPETWDEFLEAVSVLQLNNMEAWIPYTQITAATTVNMGVGGLNMYPSVLQQFGGKFFNENGNKCIINDEIGLKAFSFWTDMYTKFKLPTTASFYNRFRMGTMPLGIDVYTLYTTISSAAPDIDGRWGIALVPGIKDETGKINHTVSGSGTGCVIIKDSKNTDEAWEFLKWWTDAETQLMYNNNVESIIGTISRTTTSNLQAFSEMDWKKEDLEILLEQRKWIEEIPEVPGSYYVSRSVDQAFWNVINKNGRVKDILDNQTEIATTEIQRKIAEYSKSK